MKKSTKYLLFLLSIIVYIWLGYFVPRENFVALISGFFILFGCYFYFLKTEIPIWFGIAFRLVLLFSLPKLSDDFYRFVWDGKLLIHGINPYLILPKEFIQSPDYQQVIGDLSIFSKLNSPNYFTIYPPINQAIFGISAWLSGGSPFWNVVVLRSFILTAEIGTIYLISQKKLSFKLPNYPITQLPNSYILNPFIILELTGNLHFEAVMIFLLLLTAFFWQKENRFFSAIFFALAVSTKLLPLIFIPLIFYIWGFRKGLVYAFIVGFTNIILFMPFLDKALIIKILSSLNLYFQKFEFNASIYYLVREIGYILTGYNIIGTAGKVMALLTILSIFWISFIPKISLANKVIFILVIYFAFATTVHPWYISTLICASIFTNFRFPIVWSMLLPLTYFAYSTKSYHENLWIVFLEYSVVFGVMIYEIRSAKIEFKSKI
jgi:alpha-1,6-mannosyltransferase